MTDWQVGDLAVCVKDVCPVHGRMLVEKGRVYKVAAVGIKDGVSEQNIPCLGLEGIRDGRLGIAFPAFRKVRPDEHEACEEEFVTLLRKSKRRVEA